LPLKSEIKNRSETGTSLSRLQVTRCTEDRYCLLHVVVQGPERFEYLAKFLYDVRLRNYEASKLPNFRILAYFSIQNPEKVPTDDQPTAQGLHRRMTTILPCGSRRSQGVPSGSGVLLRLLVGELGTPKLAQIFAYGKWLYPYRMLRHGASDLDQRCLKMRSSKDRCTLPPNIFAPTQKITPKPHFRANPIIERALRKSHVNGATKLKRYSYTGIDKYFTVCQNFSARKRLGAQVP